LQKQRTAAVPWPEDARFQDVIPALLMAAASHDFLLVCEGHLNIASSHGVREALACFAKDRDLMLVHGPRADFCVARSEFLAEFMILCEAASPSNVREMILAYKESLSRRGRGRVKQIPMRMGLNLNSEAFRKAMNGRRDEMRKERELSEIFERLRMEDPGRCERLLGELGEACLKEMRCEDVDWQLKWVTERLEDLRLEHE